MKVFVCWESKQERRFAEKVAQMIRVFLKKTHPNVVVSPRPMSDDKFSPYRNDSTTLAAEAQRLLDAQEAAFAEPVPANEWDWEVSGRLDQSQIKAWGGQMVRSIQGTTPRPPAAFPLKRAAYTLEQLANLRNTLYGTVMPAPIEPYVFGDPVDRSGATGPNGESQLAAAAEDLAKQYKLGKKP